MLILEGNLEIGAHGCSDIGVSGRATKKKELFCGFPMAFVLIDSSHRFKMTFFLNMFSFTGAQHVLSNSLTFKCLNSNSFFRLFCMKTAKSSGFH